MRFNRSIRGAQRLSVTAFAGAPFTLATLAMLVAVALPPAGLQSFFGANAHAATTSKPATDDSRAAHVLRLKVARGDSLYSMFKANDIDMADLNRLVKSSRLTRSLRNVHAGRRIDLILSQARQVLMLRYALDGGTDLLVTRSEGAFTSAKLPADDTWRDRDVGVTMVERRVAPAPVPVVDDAAPVVAVTGDTPVMPTSTAPELKPEAARERMGQAVTANNPRPAASSHGLTPGLFSHTLKIAPGDSLFSLFTSHELNQLDLHNMTRKSAHKDLLGRLQPGQSVEVKADAEGNVHALTVHVSDIAWVDFERAGDTFESTRHEAQLERRVNTVSAVVKSSLYETGLAAGLSNRLIMQMVNMFSWDIDFALDIRQGDRFSVVYESLYRDGKKLREGNLLAAEFVNQGRAARGVRFEEEPGQGQFYTPSGMSMRKAFLRTPVNFTRISSRFSKRRYHPVLHKFRAHKGVDYAAPRGTPVKSAGNGKVKFAGRKRGYGNVVIIQHGSEYTTLYGHLNRIARGMKVGKRVKQGEQIGTVGSTGLATGPHLHYEFRVRGVHMDPLKVTLPRAMPLDKKLHERFERHTQPLLAKLDELSKLQVAALAQ